MANEPRVFNQEAAHGFLNECGVICSRRKVRRWFSDRKLPVFKLSLDGRLYINEADLIAFINKEVGDGR